jgi:uncharacterized repeat protein (TIGR03803 family)
MRIATFASILAIGLIAAPYADAQESVIYSFKGQPDGSSPFSGVVLDPKTGVLYGTTLEGGANNLGTVFQLTPPTSGSTWTEQILWSFGGTGDGAAPRALVENPKTGVLYGITMARSPGRGAGSVFSLTPPSNPGGPWAESFLDNTPGWWSSPGSWSSSQLAMDSSGSLYGITTGITANDPNGFVYKLSLLSNSWLLTPIFNFPYYGLGGAWSFYTVGAGIFIDGSTGYLYGTGDGTQGPSLWGNIFQLVPPSPSLGPNAPWTENILHAFGAPTSSGDGNLPMGALAYVNGVISGTTAYGGSTEQ